MVSVAISLFARIGVRARLDYPSSIFEDYCRQQYTDASRYWEGVWNLIWCVASSTRLDSKRSLSPQLTRAAALDVAGAAPNDLLAGAGW